MKKFIVVLLAALLAFGTITAYAQPSPGGGTRPEGGGTVNPGGQPGGSGGQQGGGGAPGGGAPGGDQGGPGGDSEEGESEGESAEAEAVEVTVSEVDFDLYEDEYELENGETLTKEDIQSVIENVNDPDEETMSVEEAAEILKAAKTVKDPDDPEKEITVYTVYVDGEETEVKAEELELDKYSFVTEFQDAKAMVDGEETFEVDGEEASATLTLKCEFLEGMEDAEEIEDYMIMLINPLTGETVFITLDEENVDLDKDPIELTVEFPFLGTFAFVQKDQPEEEE